MKKNNPILLGDYSYKKKFFSEIDHVFEEFYREEFNQFPDRLRSEKVNHALLSLIQKEPDPAFLLPAVLDYVERIDRERILHHYAFTSFELWLNQFSNLSFEENIYVRGKIAGKWIPRDEYQAFFPIGMEKVYPGTHFVTAHKSPDLDTTIASFWGWIDSFAARVGDGLHIWNLPGGPPASQIEIKMIFKDVFGPAVFTHLAKERTTLTLTGNDMMTQEGVIKKTGKDTVISIDHERQNKAIILVDEKGFYLGDWRSMDVESVRQITMFMNSSLRWFENNLHVKLITLFAEEKVQLKDVTQFINSIFSLTFQDSETIKELNEPNREILSKFLMQVLQLEKGLQSSFEEFGQALAKLSIYVFADVKKIVDSVIEAQLFDQKGSLIENRPRIFFYLEKIIKGLHLAVQGFRKYTEQLEIAFHIKTQVFGHAPKFVSVRSDIEEMRMKMGSYLHLTVTYPDQGKLFPVGVVKAQDLRKPILGTVSLRDFCNLHEITVPSYLEVISVIDHHKAALDTLSPSMTLISDAQASNALVAEIAFSINDRYSVSSMSLEMIEKQLASNEVSDRLKRRLLMKKIILNNPSEFYIHPDREIIEYLHFLYGILDDTDLLMKVSNRDVECVISLLNRLKSLISKKEVEIINVNELPKGREFAPQAVKKILQNEDMYSLYQKVYLYREKEIEVNIQLCAEKKTNTIFSDVKEQNGCARVGQTKLFAKNIASFTKNLQCLRKNWILEAEHCFKQKPEIDLHLHMISTIVGAEEVYKGLMQERYSHKDQLWMWIAPTELGIEHLKRFLNALQNSEQIQNNDLSMEFLGDNAKDLELLFSESFVEAPKSIKKEDLPMAVLYFNAGSINSRKAMISPYLPSLAN